jgi:hypothetical protein
MHAGEDRQVLAAGVDEWSDRPIIVRLSGAPDAAGPGVIGVTQQGVDFVDEETRDIVLEVRRTGGNSGPVSAGFRVFGSDDVRAATGGEDFVEDAGRLEWGDGDVTVRSIRVRLLDDDTPEEFEHVSMQLADVQGGAGLGTEGAIIEILANDGPIPLPPPPPPPTPPPPRPPTDAGGGGAAGFLTLILLILATGLGSARQANGSIKWKS